MGDFDSIVGISLNHVRDIGKNSSHGSGIASQLVGNDPQWFGTLAARQSPKESLCRALITMRLNQDVDHVAVLVHGTPQILLLAVDSHEDLVQVPVVAQPSLTCFNFRA